MASDEGKKRIAIIAVSSVFLIAVVAAVTFGINNHHDGDSNDPSNGKKKSQVSDSMKAIKDLCAPTDYKKTCEENLRKEAVEGTTDTNQLIQAALKATRKFVENAAKNSVVLQVLEKDNMTHQALGVCKKLMNFSINELEKSLHSIGKFEISKASKILADLNIWLSATIANENTCLEGFKNSNNNAGERMKKALKNAVEMTKNGLVIVSELSTMVSDLQVVDGTRRRLLSKKHLPILGHFSGEMYPSEWFEGPQFRRLLKVGHRGHKLKPNVIVAKDGSGKYTTIKEAFRDIPFNNTKPFVIYVKEGIYEEHIIIDFGMVHVALIGDGAEKTRIRGRLSNADHINTFNTATMSIYADHFFAKNIGFENTAGAIGYQAVALLVMSDFSVFYNCTMDGYQDTLYVHTKRQFYRNCNISGTIDFVFGDAAAVFQNCNFLLRKPLDNQQNIIVAHNRGDERQATGIIIQNSTIEAHVEYAPFKAKYPSYLARPWAAYARTIIMESFIDDSIVAEGWTKWDGNFGLDTCFFAEFNNHGPGANTFGRVNWKGIKTITSNEALEFSPSRFILGDTWVKRINVPYFSGLFEEKVNTTMKTMP